MSRSKLVLASVLIVLIALWLSHAFHYYFLIKDYASHGYHIEYPMLYIAVESWFLLCLVMITIVLLVAIKLVPQSQRFYSPPPINCGDLKCQTSGW